MLKKFLLLLTALVSLTMANFAQAKSNRPTSHTLESTGLTAGQKVAIPTGTWLFNYLTDLETYQSMLSVSPVDIHAVVDFLERHAVKVSQDSIGIVMEVHPDRNQMLIGFSNTAPYWTIEN